jgi:hypothetical protein
MQPTACLFVSAAETIWQMTDRFEPAQIGVSYVYRPIRRGARRSVVAADVAALQRPSQLNPSLVEAGTCRSTVSVTKAVAHA